MMINQGMWNDNPFDSWTEEEEHLSNMGVISFGKGGGPPPTPAHTTTQTTSQYPDELKPFIQDIFGKAKGIEDQRSSQGYQAYDAPRIAGFNQDQQNAFTGIRDAQGASTPYFEAQETLIDRSTAGPSAARTAQYMNPYTQNVIDIQQRELGRMGAQERQRIGAGAVGAGGYGGSRQAILEAEQMRNQGMRSDDIQAKGMNQAFAQAQQAMSQADARGLQGAGMYGQMATQVPGQRMKELGALAGVGAADQTQQQRALDLGYQQFQDEYNYPMKTLNDYSAILRGFPLPANTSSNQTAYSAVAPLSSQLLGAGAGLTGMAGMAGLFGASGGQVKKLQQGGLASMYTPPSNKVRMGKTNYADGDDDNIFTGGYEGSIVNQGLDAISAMPDRIVGGAYNLASLPFEAIAGLFGQNLDLDYGKTKEDIAKYFNIDDKYQANLDDNKFLMRANDKIEEEEVVTDTTATPAPIDPTPNPSPFDANLMNKYIKSLEVASDKVDSDAATSRIRMQTWGPVLANASKIMATGTLNEAIGAMFDTGAAAMAGKLKGESDETTRRAGLRKASLDNAKTISEISKNLDSTASLTLLTTTLTNMKDQGYKKSDPEVQKITEDIVRLGSMAGNKPELQAQIYAALTTGNPWGKIDASMIDLSSMPDEFVEGFEQFIVKKKEGGKIRSFDFVGEGDTLRAVLKEE